MALILTFVLVFFCSPFWAWTQETPDSQAAHLRVLGDAVRHSGYPCPRAAAAKMVRDLPDGNEFQVFCGPESGGVYENAKWVYRVTLRGEGLYFAKPWK